MGKANRIGRLNRVQWQALYAKSKILACADGCSRTVSHSKLLNYIRIALILRVSCWSIHHTVVHWQQIFYCGAVDTISSAQPCRFWWIIGGEQGLSQVS